MSVLGNLIVIIITAAATYFGVTQLGLGGHGGPLTLSPEIQKYVDAKLAGANMATSGQDLQKNSARLLEMEKKLIEIEKTKATYEQLAGKTESIENAIGEQRRRREELMATARVTELAQLRNDIATVCAGVTIKRVQSNSKNTSSPEAQTFRNNIGAGGGNGGGAGGPNYPGAAGGRGQQMPQWMQKRRGGGGGGGGGGNPPGSGPAPGGPQGGQSP